MKKDFFLRIAVYLWLVVVLTALAGCGHNVVSYGDGIMLETTVNPETWALGLSLRYGKILTACVRENVSLEMQGDGSGRAADGKSDTSAAASGSIKLTVGKWGAIDLIKIEREIRIRVIYNYGSFSSVKNGSHRVIPFASYRRKHLTDNVTRKLHYCYGRIVYGPIFEHFMITVSARFDRVTRYPAKKVDSVAGTADNGLSILVSSPTINTFSAKIIMSIFTLNKVKLTDNALFNKALGFDKSGSITANLTHHEKLSRFVGSLYHFLTFLGKKCHGLLAQNVTSCT